MSSSSSSTFISVPTLEGDLVIELYTSFAPRACKYLTEILASHQTQQQQQFAFTTRDSQRAIVTSTTASSNSTAASDDSSYFFGDELAEACDKLKFTGAGIIGVPCEPNFLTNAFFVTLVPMIEEDSSIVAGRVVQGLNSVVGFLARAKLDGTNNRRFINPLKILRAASVFEGQEPTPRPKLSSVVSNNNSNTTSTNNNNNKSGQPQAVQKKKGSLLDCMFDDDE